MKIASLLLFAEIPLLDQGCFVVFVECIWVHVRISILALLNCWITNYGVKSKSHKAHCMTWSLTLLVIDVISNTHICNFWKYI